MNPSKNGASDATVVVPVMFDMTLPTFEKAAKRAFVLWQMRDRPSIATLFKRLGISRPSLYREFADLLTWEHVTFNWHPFVHGGFPSSPRLDGACCAGCDAAFKGKGEFIFIQNVALRHEITVPAYHAGCLRMATAKETLAARAARRREDLNEKRRKRDHGHLSIGGEQRDPYRPV